jgi:hypothetical protein
MTHHEHHRHQHDTMGWEEDSGHGYQARGGGQPRFGRQGPADRGEYGGWASGEGQGEFGGDGYSAQGQFSNQRVAQYGDQGYDQDYGRQGIGWQNRQDDDPRAFGQGRGWEQGPPRERDFRGERQFRDRWQGSYGSDPVTHGQHSMRSHDTYGPAARDREQGAGGGYWGQGAGGGQGIGGSDTGFSMAGSWMAGPHSGRGPQGYQRSDARIEEDVCEHLTHHGMLDATGIQVQVAGGEVTLTGTVESRQAKRMAEDILDRISGIRDIHNQLRVQQGQDHQNPFMAQGQMSEGDGRSSNGQSRSQSQRNEKMKAGAGAS